MTTDFLNLTTEEENFIYSSYLTKNEKMLEEMKTGKFDDLESDLILFNTFWQNEIKKFPFIKMFLPTIGTNIGEFMEEKLVEPFFEDFIRVTGENFDGWVTNGAEKLKIEVKTIRVLENDKTKDYINRAKEEKDKLTKISNTTFQQVKPGEFDYMLGLLVFKDKIEVFVVQNTEINHTTQNIDKNLIKLSGQHKGNIQEGQITISNLKKKKKNIGFIKVINNLVVFTPNQQNFTPKISVTKFVDII